MTSLTFVTIKDFNSRPSTSGFSRPTTSQMGSKPGSSRNVLEAAKNLKHNEVTEDDEDEDDESCEEVLSSDEDDIDQEGLDYIERIQVTILSWKRVP